MRFCQAFMSELFRHIGGDTDVPAGDMGVGAREVGYMAGMMKKLSNRFDCVFTGKGLSFGGSLVRPESTGYGTVYFAQEMLQRSGRSLEGMRVSVSGSGNVAQYAIQLFTRLGGKVVAVSSWDQADQTSYTFRRPSGVNFEELHGITDKFGAIDKAKAKGLGFEVLAGDVWSEQDVDILIPAALENQIRADNAEKISTRVRFVAEGANGPTTPEADEVLKKRNVFVIPDFLANAGGVTCSYFEQVQSNMNYYWERDEVLSKLDQKMTSAFHAVHDVAAKQKLFMRDAAYVVAINRVARACRDRGWV
jgi:glutamate dehydrogenase (NAD(P)+)